MNKDQVESNPSEQDKKAREAARKAAEGGNQKQKDETGKHGDNNGAVLGDINDDAGKEAK
ncbi:hypothetical protein [Isoalcanivorax indicus]|uniref:hypothetical protein n=1 Tax=Isoalcanivorax indicus TaxID=2202653 RepID=UPI000DB95CE1|nr:hypothetical protein [Isoalcanivorax indicus]